MEGRVGILDAPAPTTHWALHGAAPPHALIKRGSWIGEYSVIAFAKKDHAYVLRALGQTGAWRGIGEVATLGEDGSHRSGLVGEHFFGVGDVSSPDGEFIAFVGQNKKPVSDNGFRLFLLDVAKGTLRDLGTPPASPPETEPSMCQGRSLANWVDAAGIAGYQKFDDGIISFTEEKVRVSFGKDTCFARGKPRTTREFSLR